MQLALVEIPDKVFFRIGEVSRLTGVKAYVLRYWETEFPGLRPKKSKSGQRLYRKADVEMVLRIKDLLWERKFTIKGAKVELRSGGQPETAGSDSAVAARVSAPDQSSATSPADDVLAAELRDRKKDLNTVRSVLVSMRANVAAFLDDLSQ